ncbi:hypothetical protein shim_16250 [Shimia sp. SK013]|uniref:DUF2218 domain-containing protein n=1 Tax=Shimia sp. SK013 TaxID=1389006 RepID=UPI0006B4AD8B|nr:DUF2218 domain-containing protein [Shimia sp. SK013]KPA22178.1 hypothetical protein shim_16250 [Shimia sp. SK013]
MTTQNTATAATENASRYLQQLCKHWSHKCETEFSPEAGTVVFPENRGTLSMQASESSLTMTISVPDPTNLAKMQDVVDKHLLRFAFREDLAINWA